MIGICTKEGMDALERAGKRFFRAMHPNDEIDVKHFRSFWEKAQQQGVGCLIGEFEGGEAKGVFGLIMQPDIWSGRLMASEVVWYSEGKEGFRLLAVAEQIARQNGCTKFYLQHMAEHSRLDRIYKRKGYMPDTARFCKEL